ncbi:sensor histidine kinase [Mycolicibacterium vinylchloridicum]|uniref:sensor histidine kinase n=1 Tax=Mycolicibacterium vinylchloridicum TaxID=2736928 RepID=UPI0015C95026|nr:ATP-binding protein [Mycolicibacterium vinylchloridicum]
MVWAVAFSAVFVAAGAMAVRTGDVLDASREHAYRTAVDAAAQEARDSERARYDALVHDRVLAVLLNVGGDQLDNRELAQRAEQVMRELDATVDDSDGPVDVRELGAIARRAIGADDSAPVPITSLQSAATGTSLIPGAVAHALGNATAEAVRNSKRHAGPDSSIRVTIEASGQAVTVTILDTGRGFDPASVAPDRMGVAVSIRDRMAAVGGRASVVSRPGQGTRVTLIWPMPL